MLEPLVWLRYTQKWYFSQSLWAGLLQKMWSHKEKHFSKSAWGNKAIFFWFTIASTIFVAVLWICFVILCYFPIADFTKASIENSVVNRLDVTVLNRTPVRSNSIQYRIILSQFLSLMAKSVWKLNSVQPSLDFRTNLNSEVARRDLGYTFTDKDGGRVCRNRYSRAASLQQPPA